MHFQATILLLGFAECCSNLFLEDILTVVINNISNSQENVKKSAIVAFGCILKCRFKDKLAGIIINSLDNFFALIYDEKISLDLKETIFWVLTKICKTYAFIFETEKNKLASIINLVLLSLHGNNDKIIGYAFQIIQLLYKNLKSEPEQISNVLSSYTKELIERLYCFTFDQVNLQGEGVIEKSQNSIELAFFTLSSIIENSCLDNKLILQDFFQKVLIDFKASLAVDENKIFSRNYKIRNLFQTSLSMNLISFLISGNPTITEQLAFSICELIIASFKQRQEVYEEGMFVISEIAGILNAKFELIFQQEFGNYLVYALNSDDFSIKKSAMMALSNIIRGMEVSFEPYVSEIFGLILQLKVIMIFFIVKIMSSTHLYLKWTFII